MECVPCLAQYVGSTSNIPARFGNHKCNAHMKNSVSCGLAKHFKQGCPHDQNDRNMPQLRISIIDYMNTSEMSLQISKHQNGPQCRCSECEKLKTLEDKWILRLGTYEGNGLNDRNEIKSKCRGQW